MVVEQSWRDLAEGLVNVDGMAHLQCLARDGQTLLEEQAVLLRKEGEARYAVVARVPEQRGGWRIGGLLSGQGFFGITVYRVVGRDRIAESRIFRWDGRKLNRPEPGSAYIRDGETLLVVHARPLVLHQDEDGMLSGPLTVAIRNRGKMTPTDVVVRIVAPVPLALDGGGMYSHPGDWRQFGPDDNDMYAAVAHVGAPAPGDVFESTMTVHVPEAGIPLKTSATIQLTSIDYDTPMPSVSDGLDQTRLTIDVA
jgi:hypothetical protein